MRQFHMSALLVFSTLSNFAFCAAAERVPPKGVEVPAPVKAELEKSLAALDRDIATLKTDLKERRELIELLPDVQIFANAVRFALEDDMFYGNSKTGKVADFDNAKKLLALGAERAKDLRSGKSPWTTQTGPVVRGYNSKLDGTAIPYGLQVPPTFKAGDKSPRRLDYWFMGRDNNNSELHFISGRLNGKSTFTPDNTFVLHPYGRYCNAYKFAGEVDALEALDHVRAHYPVDDNKISVRGFSMGGAATWHLAAHLAGRWASANPGAGFTDVPTYQKIAPGDEKYPWYERKLWHLYDTVDYAINLTNSTLVAYSGEIDPQKAAADLMQKTLAALGVKMTHIVGPQTGHKYEPMAQAEVAKLVDAAANKGRDAVPQHIRFTTWSLKYNRMKWIEIDALEKHWERANIDANFALGSEKDGFVLHTSNITALSLVFEHGQFPFVKKMPVIIDNALLYTPDPAADKSLRAAFVKRNGKWEAGAFDESQLRKRHDLQGPIDDAFMNSFIFVQPTGAAFNEKLKKWTDHELAAAIKSWHLEMRGEARVKKDSDITTDDIANSNLILFGDPSSNSVLAKISDKLPLKWTAQALEIGAHKFPADANAPLLIYPNPLNPQKYIVLNSGFTFNAFESVSNARQTPKLPDWAVVDLDVPDKQRLEKGVKDAGFFGEKWEYLEERK